PIAPGFASAGTNHSGGGDAQHGVGPTIPAANGDGGRHLAAGGGKSAMTFGRLLLRNLLYHWRGNIAVLLGVVVSTAVLTGAVLVGDSLTGSLRDVVLEQLGWVDHALVAGRFIREDLASELGADRVSPAILLQGAASAGATSDKTWRRAGRVTILGV